MPQFGQYLQNHIGQAEGHVGQQQRPEAQTCRFSQTGADEHEHQHQRDTGDDVRIGHGDDPDEYLKLDAQRDYLDMYSPVYHYAVFGKNFPEKKMEKYLQMLEMGYDLEPAEVFQEKGEFWREYTVYNADGEECICIWVSNVSGGEYEMSISLYADYCQPESADEWGQQEEPATQNKKKDGILHMPPPDDFFGNLL